MSYSKRYREHTMEYRQAEHSLEAAFETHCGGIRLQRKKTTSYQEQDRQKAAAYQEEIKDIPLEKVAYVDESGIDTYWYREYGYALRVHQVFG